MRKPRRSSSSALDAIFEAFGIPARVTPPGKQTIETRMLKLPSVQSGERSPGLGGTFDEQTEAAHQRFKQYGDPFAPWQVYFAARALRRSVPEWVGQYLDVAARRIVAAFREGPETSRQHRRCSVRLQVEGRWQRYQ